jgi:hypothetical protein
MTAAHVLPRKYKDCEELEEFKMQGTNIFCDLGFISVGTKEVAKNFQFLYNNIHTAMLMKAYRLSNCLSDSAVDEQYSLHETKKRK